MYTAHGLAPPSYDLTCLLPLFRACCVHCLSLHIGLPLDTHPDPCAPVSSGNDAGRESQPHIDVAARRQCRERGTGLCRSCGGAVHPARARAPMGSVGQQQPCWPTTGLFIGLCDRPAARPTEAQLLRGRVGSGRVEWVAQSPGQIYPMPMPGDTRRMTAPTHGPFDRGGHPSCVLCDLVRGRAIGRTCTGVGLCWAVGLSCAASAAASSPSRGAGCRRIG